MTVMCYVYGALPPTENKDVVSEQMFLAHRYGNEWIRRELDRRNEIDALKAKRFPDIATKKAELIELHKQVEAIEEEVKTARQQAGYLAVVAEQPAKAARAPAPKETKEQIKQLKKAISQARKELSQLNKEAAASLKEDEEYQAILTKYNLAEKEYRKSTNAPYWGTYQMVEEAKKAACKKPNPRFKRWTGDGGVAVHFQNNNKLDSNKVFEKNSLAYVDFVPSEAYHKGTPGRKKLMRTNLHMRVGPKDNPAFTTIPFVMHRPLPENSTILWVKLFRNRVADRERWEVQFVIKLNEPENKNTGVGHAGIDLGWRKLSNGDIRIASLVDDCGHQSELLLPAQLANKYAHMESLSSIIDSNFDQARDRAVVWAKENLPEAVASMSKWKNPRHLVKFIRENKDAFTTADAEYFNAWYHQHRHLWQWREFERKKVFRRRREIFRNWVSVLRETYATIALEKMSLAGFGKQAKVENAPQTHNQKVRRQKSLAAPGMLRTMIKEAFGDNITEVVAAYTSMTCAKCGYVNDKSAKTDLVCGNCGSEYDRDENAAQNILARATAA